MQRVRRIIWSSADQGVSSISNLLLSVLVARDSSPATFGVFALAFTIYQFGLGSSRAFVGEPALIRSGGEPVGARRGAQGILGASLAVGTVGLIVNLVAALFAGAAWEIFVLFGIGFPILMVVDSIRYYFFSISRPSSALGVDTGWLAVQLIAYVVFAVLGQTSAPIVLATWIFGALAAVICYCIVFKGWPSPREGFRWARSVRHLSFRFWAEYAAVSGVQQSIVYFSTIFNGIAAAAALRGAQVIAGPLSTISMGISVVALPAMSTRARKRDRSGLLRLSALASGTLVTVTGVYAVVVMLIPTSWGEYLLGENWQLGRSLIPLLLVQIAIGNLSYGATAGIRAMEAAKVSLRLRYITAPIVLVLIIVGASFSPAGALMGAIGGSLVQMTAWWITYVVISRRMLSA